MYGYCFCIYSVPVHWDYSDGFATRRRDKANRYRDQGSSKRLQDTGRIRARQESGKRAYYLRNQGNTGRRGRNQGKRK